MELIKDTLQKVFADLTAKEKGEDGSDPGVLLKKLLTKKDFEHIRVNNFKKGVLYIHVDSSSRLYSLGLRKTQLLQELKNSLRELKDIRFSLGDFK